ncbi:MAG: hypothetical protein ACYTXA_11935 [Nostoc sp.]
MNYSAYSLPEIKLIPLESETPLSLQERRSARPTDIRWVRGQMSNDTESYAKDLMSHFQYCDRHG